MWYCSCWLIQIAIINEYIMDKIKLNIKHVFKIMMVTNWEPRATPKQKEPMNYQTLTFSSVNRFSFWSKCTLSKQSSAIWWRVKIIGKKVNNNFLTFKIFLISAFISAFRLLCQLFLSDLLSSQFEFQLFQSSQFMKIPYFHFFLKNLSIILLSKM